MIQIDQLPHILNHINAALKDAPRLYISHHLGHLPTGNAKAYNVWVASVISLRTKETVTWEVSERTLAQAPDIDHLEKLSEYALSKLLYPAGFYRQKAKQLKQSIPVIKYSWKGIWPHDVESIMQLPGVGRKVANLIVTEAFDMDGLCVDTHVHRIANRWQWVHTSSPDDTELALRDLLPQSQWKKLNQGLVIFGQNICLPRNPHCDDCFLRTDCPSKQS